MRKDQRNLNIALTAGALYFFAVMVWLAVRHNEVFRTIAVALLSIALIAWVFSSAALLILNNIERKAEEQWQDVEMPVTTVAEMERSERKMEMHTDGKPIELVSEQEVEGKKREIEKAQRKAKNGNIDFEINDDGR